MATKPIIVYVGRTTSGGFGQDVDCLRDAQVYFLREHCGCDVVVYDYVEQLKEDELMLRKMTNGDRILLFLIIQGQYDNEHDQLLKLVRKEFCKKVHICIVKNFSAEEQLAVDASDANVSVCDSHTAILDTVALLMAAWRAPTKNNDYFGLRTHQEVRYLSDTLEKVYRANVEGVEDVGIELGVTDRNHRILFEALHLRLLPPSELKGEFDDVVRRVESVKVNLKTVTASTYHEELAKVRSFNEVERKDFYHGLLRATGAVPAEGGGIRQIEVGRGESNYGFAIDALTLESQISKGFGLHQMAAFYLNERLDHLAVFKAHRHLVERDAEDVREVIQGTVINGLEGFKTPILRLAVWQVPKDLVSRVVSYLQSNRQFILVTGDGRLIET